MIDESRPSAICFICLSFFNHQSSSLVRICSRSLTVETRRSACSISFGILDIISLILLGACIHEMVFSAISQLLMAVIAAAGTMRARTAISVAKTTAFTPADKIFTHDGCFLTQAEFAVFMISFVNYDAIESFCSEGVY